MTPFFDSDGDRALIRFLERHGRLSIRVWCRLHCRTHRRNKVGLCYRGLFSSGSHSGFVTLGPRPLTRGGLIRVRRLILGPFCCCYGMVFIPISRCALSLDFQPARSNVLL